jgi:hypothetical protein
MSVKAHFFLANWDQLVQILHEVGGPEGYWETYHGEDQAWLHHVPMSPPHEHWNAATVAYDVHETLSPHLEPRLKEPFQAILMAFGIIGNSAPQDLCFDDVFFTISMSPDTVKDVLDSVGDFEPEALHKYYELHYRPDQEGPLATFDDFNAYLRGFIDFSKEASRRRAGIVIAIG